LDQKSTHRLDFFVSFFGNEKKNYLINSSYFRTVPRFIKNKDIDFQKWDELIAKSPDSYIYGYSWYLDAVCDHWDAIVLGDYEAVLPLPNEKKMKLDTLYQPFFHHSLDVIGLNKVSEEMQQSFFKAIPKNFKIQLFRTHTKLAQAEVWNYQMIEDVSNHEEVYKGYSTNVKRQIKSAVKNSFAYRKDFDLNSFIALFKVEVGTRLNFLESDYQRLENLIQIGHEKSKFHIRSIVNAQNEIIASGVFILEKNRIIYLKGATNDEGRKNGAMQFLMDESIKEWGSSHPVFDCGGSNVESVASFYKRFGAMDVSYYHIDHVGSKILKKVIDFKRKRSNHGG
jgi:hypothetical protein